MADEKRKPSSGSRSANEEEEAISIPEEFGEPQVSVKKENGVFAVRASVKMEAVSPELAYAIMTDYRNQPRIYRSVKGVEVEETGPCTTLVTQRARWSFLLWSGVYDLHLRLTHDPPSRTISFHLERTGALRMFNGTWSLASIPTNGEKPCCALFLKQNVQLAISPPGPLATYTAQILANQVKGALNDFMSEASTRMQA